MKKLLTASLLLALTPAPALAQQGGLVLPPAQPVQPPAAVQSPMAANAPTAAPAQLDASAAAPVVQGTPLTPAFVTTVEGLLTRDHPVQPSLVQEIVERQAKHAATREDFVIGLAGDLKKNGMQMPPELMGKLAPSEGTSQIGAAEPQDETSAALARKIDPATMAAAKELLAMQHTGDNIRAMFDVEANNLVPMIARVNPDRANSPEFQAAMTGMMRNMRDAYLSHINELQRNSAILYAQNYNLNELRQIIAFYKTPVGQKMLTSTPVLMQKSLEINKEIVVSVIRDSIAKTRQQLQENGFNVPKEMEL